MFLGVVGYAKVAGQWNTNLPKQVYLQPVPNANQQQHPIPGEHEWRILVAGIVRPEI